MKAKGTHGGNLLVADEWRASATFTADARGIALLGRKGPSQGKILLMVPNGSPEIIDLRTGKPGNSEVLYTWIWPDVATRTVTVEAVGLHPRVALDAWVVLR